MSETADVKKSSTPERGIVVLSRIPHGFYEEQMSQYFSQFGPILHLRLSRNPKSGSSRHYAFIEFEDLKTAEIVADTMNNYLLYNHILQCRVLKQDEIHHYLFRNSWKGKTNHTNLAGIHSIKVNLDKDEEQTEKNQQRKQSREYLRVKKLISLGLLPEDAALPMPPKREKKEKSEENGNKKDEKKAVKVSKVKQITE